MTGKNPGKHGVYDFLQMSSDGTSRPVAARRKAVTIWEALSERGYSVGTFNVPTTYPPAPLSAFQFSGFDATAFGPELAHPKQAYQVVVDAVGEYDLSPTRLHKPEIEAEALAFHSDMPLQATEALLEEFDCDVYMVSFQAVDWAQHSALGREAPSGAPAELDPDGRVAATYRRIDGHVGTLVDRYTDDDTILVVASDHGGRPADRLVNLEKLFLDNGLMAYRSSSGATDFEARRSRARSALNLWLGLKRVAPWVKTLLGPLARRFRRGFAGYQEDMAIDWERTRAVPWAAYGQIRFNLQGRDPDGSVPPEDIADLRREVTDLLLSLRDPETGVEIYRTVPAAEDLYDGPWAHDGADLVAIPNDPRYFAVSARLRKGAMPLLDLQPTSVAVLDPPWGIHAPLGIVAFAGPGVAGAARPENMNITDVTPTLLHAIGEEIPGDLDGAVIEDLFDSAYMSQNPIEFGDAWPTPEDLGRRGEYEGDEEDDVAARLRALGYI